MRLFKWRHTDDAKAEVVPELSVADALLVDRPSDIFWRWALDGLLASLMPDLAFLNTVSQLPAHRDNALVHTLKVVDASEPALLRRWAALLHDIGKGPTFIEAPDGRSRFFEHDRIGSEMVPEIMEAHGADAELIWRVARLVRLHMRPIAYRPDWTDSAVRRLAEEATEGWGEDGWSDLLALGRSDLRGYLPEPIDRGLWVLDSLEARRSAILAADNEDERRRFEEPRSPLDGAELVALAGREPGPWVGELKMYLRGEVSARRIGPGDKEWARQVALKWLDEQ